MYLLELENVVGVIHSHFMNDFFFLHIILKNPFPSPSLLYKEKIRLDIQRVSG